MKIAILGNIMLPEIATDLHIATTVLGGWLTTYISTLQIKPEFELLYFFPQRISKQILHGKKEKLEYYGFYYRSGSVLNFSGCLGKRGFEKLKGQFYQIFEICQPNILHAFGTEFPYSAAIIEAFGKPERTIIHIQGLVSVYAQHYLCGIPVSYYHRFYFSNLVRGDLAKQCKLLSKKGNSEIAAIRNVKHVVGRTDWDQACCKQINKEVVYHFCNELLRPTFYGNRYWKYNVCEQYSVFFSQAGNPVKGFHYLLIALSILVRDYKNVKVYIAGNNQINNPSIKSRIERSAYGHYIYELINRYKLHNNIVFIGPQPSENMVEYYLKCNVFVSSSTIENSSNSICEAMMLGCPVISSDVGGIKSLVTHDVDGILYQSDAPYMLAFSIQRLFENSQLATSLGEKARERALKCHDPNKIISTMECIYRELN